MIKAQVWKAKHEFDGSPYLDMFYLVEEELPALKENEILVEALYISLDPYYRLEKVVEELPGEQVGRITDSKADGYPVGSLVCVYAGWRTHTVVNVTKPLRFNSRVEIVQDLPGYSPSIWLGAAGMPAVTAYLAMTENCKPKSGEVIVVSAASGAVGTVVGQLAKQWGLTVIGFAGSEEKCNYIRQLGFDHAFNYKTVKPGEAIDSVAPDGIDIYYDNVGGEILDASMERLKRYGRVLVCGQIANYNKKDNKVTDWYMTIMKMELRILGFAIQSGGHLPQFAEVREQLVPLITQGKLKFKEHITEGFPNMPKAFLELFTGSNFGKAILKI